MMGFRQFLQSFMITTVLPSIVFAVLAQGNNMIKHDASKQDTPGMPLHKTVEISVLMDNGDIEIMDLEEYVLHVVLGEISTGFEHEAIKAQAVAARTYTLRCMEYEDKHDGGAVCTDYRCCQAYMDPQTYYKRGGKKSSVRKVQNAVEETCGQVIYYRNEIICATYFASSGGCTEDAQEVWGASYPYLKAVLSPGEEDCGYFHSQTELSGMELQRRLGVSLAGEPKTWFGMTTYTAGGSVDLMRIGGRLYTGVELRSLFGLRSTMFQVHCSDNNIVFDVKGYGHRVGMSQHGANAMALAGYDYKQIISHYYLGTTLGQYQAVGH